VDAAVDDDIQRDPDTGRRAVTLSKLERLERLRGIVYPDDAELTRVYGSIGSPNDRSDCRLLFCIDRKAADFLITRDTGLLRRAHQGVGIVGILRFLPDNLPEGSLQLLQKLHVLSLYHVA
jgi:hypothetical protein